MRKIVLGLAFAGVLAVPVHAQDKPPTPEEIAEKRDRETLDRQYKNALKAMQANPGQAKTDPWATMRAPTAATPSAKR
jgi:hypothetical protein